MTSTEQLSFNLSDFKDNISTTWSQLQNESEFCDVTLACDDEQIQAHKVVISSYSPVFRHILKSNTNQYPLIYLRGVKFNDLNNLLKYMYQGEVRIDKDELQGFLFVAEDLMIKGLTKSKNGEKLHIDSYEPPEDLMMERIQPLDNDLKDNLIDSNVDKNKSQQIIGKLKGIKVEESIPQKKGKIKKLKQNKVALLNVTLSTPLLPDPIFECQRKEPSLPEVKDEEELEVKYEEELLDAEETYLNNKKFESWMVNHAVDSTLKMTEDIEKMSTLTPLLLSEPHRFRFFHRGLGRSTHVFKRKLESDEDYETRMTLFTQFPGLIVDGEITKMIACIGCGYIGKTRTGSSWLPSHLNECQNNADHLINKEIEVVKDFKFKLGKHINIDQYFNQVQVDKIECSICKKIFHEMNTFKDHLRDEHLVETNARKFKNMFGSFQCNECGKKFVKMNGLQQHEITVHGKWELAQHQCEECGASFSTKGKYNLHLKAKHSDERPFMCDSCAKSFKLKKHLDSHKTVHTGVKSWQCRHCEKSFSNDWNRKQHERVHLGIKPYKCDHCTAAFTQKNSLDSHEKVHHGDSKLLPE